MGVGKVVEMGRHICRKEILLDFIKKNPGLTHRMLSERFGRDVSWAIEELLKNGSVVRRKGVDPETKYISFQYFCK